MSETTVGTASTNQSNALLPHPARSNPKARRRGQHALTAVIATTVALTVVLFLSSGSAATATTPGGWLTVTGMLCGLVGSTLVLMMLLLAARIPLIDRTVGHDSAMRLHRRIGKPALYLLIGHGVFLTLGYAALSKQGILAQTLTLFGMEDVNLAYIALWLLCLVVITSLVAVRRKLSYEVWQGIHLVSYVAVAIAIPHQLSAGAVLADHTWQQAYWIGLVALSFGAIAVFRFALPLLRSLRHRITVVEVNRSTPGACTITLTGRNLHTLGAHGGQFAMWRFWTGATWWHAHPISFSAAPTHSTLRLTIRTLGAGTAQFAALAPGTRVTFAGPYGVFTNRHRTQPHLALIAAGIGVTPIRALLEHAPLAPGEATVLLRSGDEQQTYLWDEMRQLAATTNSTLHTMTGHRASGEASWLSQDAHERGVTLLKLFPNLTSSDLYVCGPAAWTDSVIAAATRAGLSGTQIHAERFDW